MKRKSRTIGFIVAPGYTAQVTDSLSNKLPRALSNFGCDRIDWLIEQCMDRLTDAEDIDEIVSASTSYLKDKQWDYTIVWTDIPLFDNGGIVSTAVHVEKRLAIFSLPAFGCFFVKKRVLWALIQTISLFSNEFSLEKFKQTSLNMILRTGILPLKNIFKDNVTSKHKRIIMRPKVMGKLQVVLGMTIANKPLKIMSSLSKVIVIAYTTGAFGLIFTTMWKLSNLFSIFRLTGLTLASIVGMLVWITIAHQLWERPYPSNCKREKGLHHLYNSATLLTLFVSIIAYYAVLYVIFFMTSIILIPPDFYTKAVQLNETAGVVEYMRLAWFAASISTFASSIGAGLENEARIRAMTSGDRQKETNHGKSKS